MIDGHMVSLLCDVQAYPPPEVIWTRDGQLLHLTTGIHILPGQNGSLKPCDDSGYLLIPVVFVNPSQH